MANAAEFGLMIWDGKSLGTILNILRLVRASKKAVLINVPDQRETNFRSEDDWDVFLSECGEHLRRSLKKRALPKEWSATNSAQASLGLVKDDGADGNPGFATVMMVTDALELRLSASKKSAT